jgi:hypothetical protein
MSERLPHDPGDLVGIIRELRARVEALEAPASAVRVGEWRIQHADNGDLQAVHAPSGTTQTISRSV